MPSVDQLEEPDGAPGLAVRRPAHVQHIVEPLDLDRAVHREVGSRAARHLALERHVDGDGAVQDRGIDP